MSGATIKVGSGAPATSTAWEGGLYLRTDAPNGGAYIGRGGVWVPLLTSTAGGSVTLAGDATGPSGSNIVVGLTGTLGHVAVHTPEITWDQGISSFGIAQTNPTSPTTPVGSFFVQLASPHASATGAARNAGVGAFNIPAPTAGGTPGRWQWGVSDAERFAVEESGVLVSSPNVHFATGVQNPLISQDRAVGDVAAQDLSISPQAPSLSATGTNRNSPKLVFGIPTPTGAGANGQYEFRIAGTPLFNVADNRIVLGSPITSVDFAATTLNFVQGGVNLFSINATQLKLGTGVGTVTSVGGITFQPESTAGGGNGVAINGGTSTGGVGGIASLNGGTGVDAASAGPAIVKSGGATGVYVARPNGQLVVGLCGSATGTNCPADGVDGGVFIKNAAAIGDAGSPVGGFYLFSAGGRPTFWFDDALPTSSFGSPVKLTLNAGIWPNYDPLVTGIFGTMDVEFIIAGVLWELAIPLVGRTH
jgi:hypothetical protein